MNGTKDRESFSPDGLTEQIIDALLREVDVAAAAKPSLDSALRDATTTQRRYRRQARRSTAAVVRAQPWRVAVSGPGERPHASHRAGHGDRSGSDGNNPADVGDKRGALAPTEEAVATYRRLAEVEPAAHLPDLAMSLWAFSWVRAAAQLELEAALAAVQEAITAYRSLAAALPGAFAGYLRAAVSTQADVLEGLGRPEEADEFRRRLNEDHPL